jgi:hypothetical protein
MNFLVPYDAGKFLRSCTTGSFSRRAQLHEWVTTIITAVTVPIHIWLNQKLLNLSLQILFCSA